MRRRVLVTVAMFAAGGRRVRTSSASTTGTRARTTPRSTRRSTPTADVHDAATVDAAPEAAFSPLSCGTGNTCNFAAGEACCRTGSTTYKCVDAAAACTGTYIPCDRPEQCPQNTEAGAMQCCTTDVLNDGGIYVASPSVAWPKASARPSPTTTLCAVTTVAGLSSRSRLWPERPALPPFLICK